MKYQNVCLEAVGYTLPEEIVTSLELEQRLAPLYQRLRLAEGRLELMTGIRERRFWPPGTLPGEVSVQTAERVIAQSGIDRSQIGAVIHGSVCRDYLEPATACSVHHRLGLSSQCVVYDVSNACLGILNGAVQIANMIELGQIRAGLVVGTESGRDLVEATVQHLNADTTLTRDGLKLAVASLTIGSASAAILLADRELSQNGNRLMAATAGAYTAGHALCQGGVNDSVGVGMRPLMQTDSLELMNQGIAAGAATFAAFLDEAGWSREDIHRTFCHQVTASHRKQMLEALSLEIANDFATYETLGNTGSAALPITLAMGLEQGHLDRDQNVALLGIGSGINSLMLALDWQQEAKRTDSDRTPHILRHPAAIAR